MDAGALVVLGSATPAIESFYDASQGKSVRLVLSERVEKRPLPAVEIVDMRRPVKEKLNPIFSPALESAVRETVAKKEQVMLLLNRRGFSTRVHCSSCGYVAGCENCRVSLAYHFDKGILLCHSCGYRSAPVRLCPGCQKNYLHYFGIGTQKVQEEAQRLFAGVRMSRMDTDSMARKDAHEMMLKAFKNHEIDILIGTQMIAKGHDFPRVSLIGVISADTALHLPDFRAAERTFDLLTQVAGRAGRGDIPGRVLIQTHVPHHYSIQSAKHHDYLEFYEKEIGFRRELRMPPFSELVRIIFAGPLEKEVIRQIFLFGKLLEVIMRDSENLSVLGPAPCLISREKGSFYWHLFAKGPSVTLVNPLLKQALAQFKKSRVTITVDVDPQ